MQEKTFNDGRERKHSDFSIMERKLQIDFSQCFYEVPDMEYFRETIVHAIQALVSKTNFAENARKNIFNFK